MLNDYDTVEELLQDIKKQSLSFSKYYTKLGTSEISNFYKKDKETQSLMLDDIYSNHSRLEQLLRGIMEYDVNAETIKTHNDEGAETEEQEYQD